MILEISDMLFVAVVFGELRPALLIRDKILINSEISKFYLKHAINKSFTAFILGTVFC